MGKIFKCNKISSGIAEGQVLISDEYILFYHTDSKTGVITEHGHNLEGISVKNKILIFRGGKGSSVVQADGMYRLDRDGTAPRGFIVKELDTVLVSSAIIMEIPMVSKLDEEFYHIIKNGDYIRINADDREVEIL